MQTSDILLALKGDSLIEAISKSKDNRKALAEGLIYEQTITMMSADPGTGKSTISTQMAVELASGLPVFGSFEVPKPLKVLYLQTERSIIELLERLEVIGKTLPINYDNLHVTDQYQKFNLLKEDQLPLFIDCIKRDCANADIIFVDPIYSVVRGGLKEDLPASIFTKVMTIVQKETGAALWYDHHTTKTQYHNGEAVQKDDPFYGSQWLKAHVTGSFHLKENPGGVRLDMKKDNYGILPKSIVLEFNAETGLCSVPLSEVSAVDKVKQFLKLRDIDGKHFTFNDISTYTKLCHRTVRRAMCHSSISERIFVVSSNKNKNLYTVTSSK